MSAEQSAEIEQLRRERDDALGGYRTAAEYLDRFRDVLADALGYEDENPGDDVLISDLRAHFGRTGPESTRWRDFCAGALAVVDQINAERRDIPAAKRTDYLLDGSPESVAVVREARGLPPIESQEEKP